jgi:hypothetical protein
VLNRLLKERRIFINEFYRQHPQESIAAVYSLYNIDPETIYKYQNNLENIYKGAIILYSQPLKRRRLYNIYKISIIQAI